MRLTARKKIFTTLATYKDKQIIRFAVGNRFSQEQDIAYAWNEVESAVAEMFMIDDRSTENPKPSITKTFGRHSDENKESESRNAGDVRGGLVED